MYSVDKELNRARTFTSIFCTRNSIETFESISKTSEELQKRLLSACFETQGYGGKTTVALRAMLVGGIAAFAKIAGAMKAAGGVKLGAAAAAMTAAATAAVSGSKKDQPDASGSKMNQPDASKPPAK